MLEKKIFDYKLEMQNCFSFNTGDGLPEFTTDSLYNAVYSIALNAKDKKADSEEEYEDTGINENL